MALSSSLKKFPEFKMFNLLLFKNERKSTTITTGMYPFRRVDSPI